MRVQILTSRPVGEECKLWVRERGVELVDSNPDVLISVMYDRVLSEFPARSFNFHPGVLPQYRGSGAFSWAIINGEVETGITLHEIDEDIDHGAIIDIVRFPVDPNDTAGTLYERGMQYLFFMFQRWFDRIVSGDYTVISQDKWRGRIYYRRDLEREKDLTRYARAFEFADKERAFYYNRKGEKVELVW